MNYEEEFKIFSGSINSAARSFYYHREVQSQIYRDYKKYKHYNDSPLFKGVDANAQFWNDYNLQSISYCIITLGRIFDKNKKSHSVRSLVSVAKESRLFTIEKLRERKIADSDNASEWIDAYLIDKTNFNGDDYYGFLRYIASAAILWKNNIKGVRNKFYAHQARLSPKTKKEILDKAQYDVVEEIISKLLTIEYIMFQAFHNGKKPDFNYKNETVRASASKDISNLLLRLSKD